MGSHLGTKGPKNHQKSPKIGYFSHILGIRAISPIHWIKFLIGKHMIECPKDKIIIHRASGEGYGVPSGLQRSKKSSKITKIGYFSHIMAIRAISPIHWIKFLFGTHMIECPKDKIVIHRVSGEGYWVPPGLQRAQNSQKFTQNWLFFSRFCKFLHLDSLLNYS